MTRRLSIVVVSYGSSTLLAGNLVATQAAAPEAEIVVVDNLSSEGERTAVRALAAQNGWHLLAPSDNLGFGAGVNAGAEEAFARGATDLLVLNPDATIDSASIAAMDRVAESERMTLMSPIVKEPSGRVWFGGLDLYLDDGTHRAPRRRAEHPGARRVEWLSGACLWITREVWEAVGGFDDEYFLYWEDVDFSFRAAAAGIRLAVIEGAVAVHDEGATHRTAMQRSEAKSETYYYFNIRNRLLFAARHLGADDIRVWLRTARRNAWQVLLRGGRRQFLRPVAPLRAMWTGLRDGRRLARTALSRPDEHSGG